MNNDIRPVSPPNVIPSHVHTHASPPHGATKAPTSSPSPSSSRRTDHHSSCKAPSHLGKSNPPLPSAPVQHYLYLSSAAPAEHAKQRAQPSPNRDTAEALQTGAGPCLNIAIRLVPLTLRCATSFCVDPVGKTRTVWLGCFPPPLDRPLWPSQPPIVPRGVVCEKRKVMAHGLEVGICSVKTGSALRDVGGGCEWYLGSEGETVAVFCFVVPRGAKSRGGMDGRLELAGCLYWPGPSALSTWT
jgi:hypothetical protein